ERPGAVVVEAAPGRHQPQVGQAEVVHRTGGRPHVGRVLGPHEHDARAGHGAELISGPPTHRLEPRRGSAKGDNYLVRRDALSVSTVIFHGRWKPCSTLTPRRSRPAGVARGWRSTANRWRARRGGRTGRRSTGGRRYRGSATPTPGCCCWASLRARTAATGPAGCSRATRRATSSTLPFTVPALRTNQQQRTEAMDWNCPESGSRRPPGASLRATNPSRRRFATARCG